MSSSPSPPPTSMKSTSPEKMSLMAIEEEEKYAISQDSEKECDNFLNICQLIRMLLEKMKTLKKSHQPELEEHKNEVVKLFMMLKKINRHDKIRIKHGRDQVTEAKQKMDFYHLQLQNLMYQVFHIRREIIKCHEFKSRQEEIDLVDVKEFYEEAPAEVTEHLLENPDDQHQLTLARLELELKQRIKCTKTLEDRKKVKSKIKKEIREEIERLDSIKQVLSKVVEASLPLTQKVGFIS